jgi:hypothetical protein
MKNLTKEYKDIKKEDVIRIYEDYMIKLIFSKEYSKN